MAKTRSSSQQKRQSQLANDSNKKTSADVLSSSSSKESVSQHIAIGDEEIDDVVLSGCSTPKSERHRIPEVLSCPSAPKKRKVAHSFSSVRSRPIAFFAPPDLELFFFFAFRDRNTC